MKKFVLSIVMMSVLVPVSLFAKPSYEEVVNTVKSVMGVYGLSLMSGMFGPAILVAL
ncbi:MAG TPA: hypothetical protein VFC68_02400 [Treponemataceae bacterium]|nr:hypothetical protein [Treponemataceae bacterium]